MAEPTRTGTRRARRIGIIGAGPGGICMGIALRQAGVDTLTIFERAPEVGGTWFLNTSPGAACAAEVWNVGAADYYRGPSGRIVTQWPHSMSEYEARTSKPDPDAYEVHRASGR